MNRFAVAVMTLVMALSLVGVSQDAHAGPGTVAAGDPVTQDGAGGSGGGSGGAAGGDGGAAGGGGGSGVPGGSGGGGADPGVPGLSTPRVMLAGFASSPATVQAGEDFTVSFTLENTSKRTRVQNIKVSLSSGEGAAFLPANGSSSMFIDRISAGGDSLQTMAFHSLPSLEERPYQMTLSVEYEDAAANAYQSQETVSVSVKQAVRADTSAPQVIPEAVQVGQDASVTFNIHNQGKTKLYNAKALVKEGQPVSGEDMFIGTIEPGTSGAVDMIVRAEEETSEPLLIEVTYEDVDGKVTSLSKKVPLTVMPMDMGEEFPVEEPPMEEEGGLALLPIVGGLFLLLSLVVVLLLVRRARRRSRERDDMESLSMIDDDPLVPTDTPRS